MIFDPELKFDKHINSVISKANQIINIIKRTFLSLEPYTACIIYKSLIRPILEYANIIWSPLLKRQSIALENVQRRYTKHIPGRSDKNYEEQLTALKLPSLKYGA